MRLPFYDTNRLDTPTKRVGYILLLLGVGITITSILIFSVIKFRPGYWGRGYFYSIFIGWPTEFIDDFMDQGIYRKVFFLGVCLSVIGFMISFAYDSTLGRLLHWIKTGNMGPKN